MKQNTNGTSHKSQTGFDFSLYTNYIPHEDGIKATQMAFHSREDKQDPTNIFNKLLERVIKRANCIQILHAYVIYTW